MRAWTLCAVAAALLCAPSSRAAETLPVGGVGGPNAVVWPHYIAEDKGYYAEAGFKVDLVYSQSNAAVLQALTAGSTKAAIAAGFADPINAVAHGAGVAVVRIDGQVGPYALMGAKTLKSIKDLKGKVVSVDEAKGTTMVYFVQMLAANGMTPNDCQLIFAGATAARFAALESGAAAAAMITAPQLFRAEADGFVNLGYDTKYSPDVPFTGELVNRAWAESHKAEAKRFVGAYSKAIRWFYDKKNRAEALDILEKASHMDRDDIAKSYDFFQQINYFDRSDTVSLAKIRAFLKAYQAVNPGVSVDLNKLVMRLD